MRPFSLVFLFFIGYSIFAQDSLSVDNKYREDQFYISLTYNTLLDNPNGINSNGFSTGYHFGFIRDMPINAKRNVAIGLGLGLSANSYNQNLLITKGSSGFLYSETDESVYGNVTKNKFTHYLLDLPIEFRWRTSNASDYKFWRIYTGFKLSYLLFNSSNFNSGLEDIKLSDIDDFNDLQYGLTLSAGYATWNFQMYYGLNPLLKSSAKFNAVSTINSAALRIGIIFYIL